MDAARRGDAQRVVWTTRWLLLLPLLLCGGKCAAGRAEWGAPKKDGPPALPRKSYKES